VVQYGLSQHYVPKVTEGKTVAERRINPYDRINAEHAQDFNDGARCTLVFERPLELLQFENLDYLSLILFTNSWPLACFTGHTLSARFQRSKRMANAQWLV